MGTRPFKRGWAFVGLAAILTTMAGLSIEPMRWSLPVRYLFKPFDIYRIGVFDYAMCMRVELSPKEADDFVRRWFDAKDLIAHPVPTDQGLCPASFWPKTFRNPTHGYKETRWSNGMIEGSTGAVYEQGALYFWSWTM